MEMSVDRVDLWAAGMNDKPGELARVLNGLKSAGADFDFVIARRDHENPGKAVVFVSPLRREKEISAATALGFKNAKSMYSVRVEGENRAGIGADLTNLISQAGISIRGFSGATCGSRFVLYFSFDVAEDADKSMSILCDYEKSCRPMVH